jgi:hypothetical protein
MPPRQAHHITSHLHVIPCRPSAATPFVDDFLTFRPITSSSNCITETPLYFPSAAHCHSLTRGGRFNRIWIDELYSYGNHRFPSPLSTTSSPTPYSIHRLDRQSTQEAQVSAGIRSLYVDSRVRSSFRFDLVRFLLEAQINFLQCDSSVIWFWFLSHAAWWFVSPYPVLVYISSSAKGISLCILC